MGIHEQILAANRFEFEKIQAKMGIEKTKEFETTSDLNKLKGMGAKTLSNFAAAGITSIEQLKEYSDEEITEMAKSPLTIKLILKSLKEYT